MKAWIALPLLLVLSAPARADILLLKDGRVVQDRELERVDQGIEIAFENGVVLVPLDLVEEALIEGEVSPPATPEEQAQAAKGNVRFEGRWVTVRRRDELIGKRLEAKRNEVAEMVAHREWRNRQKETTKHFAFEYTIPQSVFVEYRDLMEAYFSSFLKEWRIDPPRDLKPLSVCLHIDHDAMVQIGGAPPYVAGYFKFVEPFDCNFFYDRRNPKFTEEVMFHETNHYLQKLLDMRFKVPHFPGESLAEYYGASRYDPKTKKITSGLVLEGRLVEIHNDIQAGDWMGLARLVSTDGMYEHYTWGWSLVHFLMNDPRYAKKFQEFFRALPSGKDVRREEYAFNLRTCTSEEVWNAFRRYLGLKDEEGVVGMQGEWHAYIKETLTVVTPQGLEDAGRRAVQNGMPIKAKRLFQEAIEKGSTNPLTYHRLAQLLEEEEKEEKSLELWREAIELDPLDAQFYESLGRALAKRGEKEEGNRLRKLAREIEPDEMWPALKGEKKGEEAQGK